MAIRPSLILVYDLSTTGVHACLFTPSGELLTSVAQGYVTAYSQPNCAEQNADDWWHAVCATSRLVFDQARVSAHQVAVVSLSGTMNGVLAVGDDGKPLRPSIIWADQRSSLQVNWIDQMYGRDRFYQRTGLRNNAAYSVAKILWLRDCEPDVYRRTRYILQQKDYISYKLTGAIATDFSDASCTGLFDIKERTWALDIFQALELDPRKLPPVHPSTTIIGAVTEEAARTTGLRIGTPVVISGGDGACAVVGAGAIEPGDTYLSMGTSAWIARTAPEPRWDDRQRTVTLAHLIPNLYISVGAMQMAGGLHQWLARIFYGNEVSEMAYGIIDALARTSPPGANSLLFLPYLMGERTPWWNPDARGALVGLDVAHTQADIFRAMLEGVTFNLRLILECLVDQDKLLDHLRLVGGGTKSMVWTRVLADILGIPIKCSQLSTQATALGAAVAGGIGIGLWSDWRVSREFAPIETTVIPNPGMADRYKQLFEIFRDTYLALESVYSRLSAHKRHFS